MRRGASEILSTLLIVSLTILATVFISWVVSSIIGSMTQVGGMVSVAGGEVTTLGNVAFIEVTLSVSGGITSLGSVRVWHNEQGPLAATCLDCSSLFSQSYPPSRVDTLQLTLVVSSASQFMAGDFVRVEVEYASGGVTRRTSATFRVAG